MNETSLTPVERDTHTHTHTQKKRGEKQIVVDRWAQNEAR